MIMPAHSRIYEITELQYTLLLCNRAHISIMFKTYLVEIFVKFQLLNIVT